MAKRKPTKQTFINDDSGRVDSFGNSFRDRESLGKFSTRGGNVSPAALAALSKGDIANAAVAMTPGGIEAQEAAGQSSFVASETLPIKGTGDRREFEKMGIKFADKADDDLFIGVQLPEGWKKVRTDHSMWSNLVDDKGRVRANIFYKAAFYDRSAHISLSRRYSIDGYHGKDDPYWVVIKDGNEVIHKIGKKADRDQTDRYAYDDELMAKAKAWLNEKFPLWETSSAYWD